MIRIREISISDILHRQKGLLAEWPNWGDTMTIEEPKTQCLCVDYNWLFNCKQWGDDFTHQSQIFPRNFEDRNNFLKYEAYLILRYDIEIMGKQER